MVNKLYFGDNLDVLRSMEAETVDLVYLDPPFNSKANYNVLFEAEHDAPGAQAMAFKDTWTWGEEAASAYESVIETGGDVALALSGLRGWIGKNGLLAYLSMMAARLTFLHKNLKKTGSLYLHCDPTAGPYLRIMLDSIFGHRGFRNEIAWCYNKWSTEAKQFARNHDTILFYTKGERWTYNVQYVEPSAGTQKRWGGKRQQAFFDESGRRFASSTEEDAKSPCPDWWPVSILNPNASERMGYPTQKPLAILERIVAASSNPGDLILDPFCGCGTAIEAAEKLGRRWLGIDVTHFAVTVIEERLARWQPQARFRVHGRPKDMNGARELAARDKHQFEWWAAWLLGASSYAERKKGPDKGVDGRIVYKNGPFGAGTIIISVKGGENIGVGMVRELLGTLDVHGAQMGILILLNPPTKNMVSEAHAAGFVSPSAHERLPRVQIVTVEDLFHQRLPKLPPLARGERHAMPTVKSERDQLELFLPVAGGEVPKIGGKGVIVDPRFRKMGQR